MPSGANTYTTYLRTELDPQSRTSYSQLRSIAEATYRDIGRFAQEASNLTAAALTDRRQTTGLRSLETSATNAFTSIRREAATTSSAVSALQARLSGIRTASISGAVNGVSPAQVTTTRSAAAANDNLSASNRRLAASTVSITELQRRQQAVSAAAGAETTKLSRSLTVLGTTLSVVQGPLGPVAGRLNAITSAITTLGTGTLVLAGAATALFSFAGIANVYAEVESRLRPLYTSQEQVNGALRETGRIALATRSALAPTVDLYSKLTAAGREYGLSYRQVSRVTETAAKAATLSGGNAATREAGLYQFSQGLSSGTLAGDELKSIKENIPELARAIAAGFKNVDGSIGTTTSNLKALGAAGMLTTDAVVEALDRSAGMIDAKFARLPKTLSSAQTEFVTSFTLLTGQIDHTVGVTSTLAEAISIAANNLQTLLALGGTMAARFILPKLGTFLSELRAAVALQRQLSTGATTAAAAGQATLLTPTGIARAKAIGEVESAATVANQARARVEAEKQVIAAIDSEIVSIRTATAADREKARSVAANARFEVAAIEQRVAALRTEAEQTAANKLAAQTSVASYSRAAPLVSRAVQPGETEEVRSNRIIAFTEQQRAAKLQLAQADLRASAAARALAVAEEELAVATAAATEATVAQGVANTNAARSGFASLTLTENRVKAQVALAAAELEAAAAATALAAAETRLTAVQVAYNAAVTIGTTALNGIRKGVALAAAAVGGPLVLALTVATGALIYLAGQSNAALDALHNFAGGQEELYRRLGITTDKLREQADAARDLALALAQANVAKAVQDRAAANQDLAASVGVAASQLRASGGSPGNTIGDAFITAVSSAVSSQRNTDAATLETLVTELRSGRAINARGIQALQEIQRRNPGAFKTEGASGSINRFLGAAAADTSSKVLGVEASRLNLEDATKALDDVKRELAKPRVAPKPVVPLTPEQIVAQGEEAAKEEYANPRATALRKYEEAKARALADKNDSDQEKADKIRDAKAAYDAQILSIEKRDAAAARGVARREAAAHAKAEREAEKATKDAARATEQLADLRAKYDDQPKLVDQVRNDQRAFDALVGRNINVTDADGKTTRKAYTAADAAADRAKAEAALNKPFTDMTREMERQAQIQALTLQGRDAEADALGRAFQLIDRTGSLQEGQYQTLVDLAEQQDRINAALEERGRIVGTLRGAVDSMRDALTSFLDTLPEKAAQVGKTITDSNGNKRRYGGLDYIRDAAGGLGGQLLSQYRTSANKLGVDTLFGGVQKKIDDLISGRSGVQTANEFTATQTRRTGTVIQRFGDVVADVATRVEGVLADLTAGAVGTTAEGGIIPIPSVDSTIQPLGAVAAMNRLTDALKNGAAGEVTSDEEGAEITVTGRRLKTEASSPLSLRDIYNETGRSIGAKLDEALGTNFAKNVGGRLGDALSGAGKGTLASNIASAIGVGQNGTGAALGGALGGVLSGITSISSALGPFGAALSPVLGIAGGLVGNLFKKKQYGTSSFSTNEFGELVSSTEGRGSQQTAAASATASGVIDGINSIADQLGATISGIPNLTIGTYKDNYRVSTTGYTGGALNFKGSSANGLYDFGDDEQAAIEFAIRYSIEKGVISGISQASVNILKSGQDLQKALNKALLIESVPKRLLALQDPVRAAVTDLNTEFEEIIAALNEGKATAEQYAQAQQLYDLERASAIAEAQKAATSAIDNYLKEMLGGSSSPYNKRTVYENASSDLESYAADIRAGKVVDQEDFVAAAQKFQEASQALYGSSESFFSDFEALQVLLNQAKANTGVTDSSDSTTLPGSPFDSADVQAAITQGSSATVAATQDQTAALSSKLDDLIDAVRSTGTSTSTSSALDLLPGFG